MTLLKEMHYGIGLDIGITSVGYAIVALDYDDRPWGIIKMGSRIFDAAEAPDSGASLALPRREARSARRRGRRRRHRLERIKYLLVSSMLITEEELAHLFDGVLPDIYELRVRALEEKMSNTELARILIHLAQRRGFKSNRKAETKEKEAGLLLTAMKDNQDRMKAKHYRTVGEMFFKDPTFVEFKRNKGGSYLTTVARSYIEAEALQILQQQASLGNEVLTEAFQNKYLEILLSQRQFDEGPGGKSPYGGNQIAKMIGKCTFEKDEYRAAKACYSFECFNLLQKINHLRLLIDGKWLPLTEEQREKIFTLVHKQKNVTYATLRKTLGLAENVLFNHLTYNKKDAKDEKYIQEAEKKEKFNFLPIYHDLCSVFKSLHEQRLLRAAETLDSLTIAENTSATVQETITLFDAIGNILSIYKGDAKRTEELQKLNLINEEIDALLALNGLAKFAHLSVKALAKINPYLRQGMIYNEACAAAGYDFRGHNDTEKTLFLPANKDEMANITSPVARRAIAQSIKVINAIIREQNNQSPVYINIELARELAKDYDERKKIEKIYKENNLYNEKLMDKMRNDYHRVHPTGMDLLKLKLWDMQQGISPYSQKMMDVNRLFEPGYVDIDHIVPYSISFDDSLKNKVLVFSEENRDKGNRLPIPYLRQKYGNKAVENFIVWVNNSVQDYKKRLKLLKENLSADDLTGFKERNLQDTKTISRFLYNYIRDYLLFAPFSDKRKKHVTAVNGAVTAYLRKRWGIKKNRADGDLHHAVDALVIACTTERMIQDVAAYSKYKELRYTRKEENGMLVDTTTGEILEHFPLPWEDFRAELDARLSANPAAALRQKHLLFYSTIDLNTIKPIFVSRMPKHKVTGAAHKATIRSARNINEGMVISKTALTALKLDKKTGEIANYYNPESDAFLYAALKARLQQFNGNGEKAFAEPFYKPKADGTQGPLVRKVKTMEKATLTVPVLQGKGIADNDSMVRVDVFHIAGDGYYLVPIYVADTLKKELPNKAIVAYKPFAEWPEMDDNNFVFSLYPNDLIKFTHKKEVTFKLNNKESNLPKEYITREMLVYYKSSNINTGAIGIINNDNTYGIHSLGVKTLLNLEKYQVDVLGNYTKVGKEKRQKFNFKTKG